MYTKKQIDFYNDSADDSLHKMVNRTKKLYLAVPISKVYLYWKSNDDYVKESGNTEYTGSWVLPDDSPLWDNLLPWIDGVAEKAKSKDYPSLWRSNETKVAKAAKLLSYEEWHAAIAATAWGKDPLWQFKTDGKDKPGDPMYDDEVYTMDDSKVGWPRSYPRKELREKYGTTSLTAYAATQGLSTPYGK